MSELEQLPHRQPEQTRPVSLSTIEGKIEGALRRFSPHCTNEIQGGSATYRLHSLPREDAKLEALRDQIVEDAQHLPEPVTEIVIDVHDLPYMPEEGFAAIMWGLPRKLETAQLKQRVRLVGIQPRVREKLQTLQIGEHIPAALEFAANAESAAETVS